MLLEWWTSCSKIHGAEEESRFPKYGLYPQIRFVEEAVLSNKPQWPSQRKTGKSYVFPLSWYFVSILSRSESRFLRPCKKQPTTTTTKKTTKTKLPPSNQKPTNQTAEQVKNTCFWRWTHRWCIEGGKGYDTVVTCSFWLLKQLILDAESFFSASGNKNPPCT